MLVEAGVPLFDQINSQDIIWVYYPIERHTHGWLCDMMIVVRNKVHVRAGIICSDRFLSSCLTGISNV